MKEKCVKYLANIRQYAGIRICILESSKPELIFCSCRCCKMLLVFSSRSFDGIEIFRYAPTTLLHIALRKVVCRCVIIFY
jgi:hypothetical protein